MHNTIFILLLLAATGIAQTGSYTIISGSPLTFVQFESEAPLENVIGRTQTVTGIIEPVVATGDGSGRAEIHVDLLSLKTGIELRDRHMRENHLETDQYPEATFTLTRLEIPGGTLPDGIRTAVSVVGNLTLHGVTREIEPESFLTMLDGGARMRVEASFTMKMKDFGIPLPQFLVMRLSEEQKISVDLMTARN
ncbi:YceI family protein [candidate division KSB1 bacterium]|nr:YceI family protein [candidate division KSB1 bacterium]